MANNTSLLEKIITAKALLSNVSTEDVARQAKVDLAISELELPVEAVSDNQLTEKIVKAKIHLKNLEFNHTCMIDSDSDYTGPCTCGATQNDQLLYDVEKVLDLS